MKPRSRLILKIVVTLLGLALAAWQIDLGQVAATLRGVRPGWALLVVALINASLVVRAGRWWVLLRGLGATIAFKRLVMLYFAGNFFNVFLPSGFGGDVVRVVETAQDIPTSAAAGSVLVDRLTGLLMLFLLALLALPFRPATFPPAQAAFLALVAGGGLAAGLLLLDGRLVRWVLGWPLISRYSEKGSVGAFLAAVSGCGWPAIRAALGISLLFNLMLVGWWWAASRALGLDLSPADLFLAVPLLSLALLAPSIGGLGVRESIAPLLLAAAGLSTDQAVALSLLEFILMRLSGLLGAPVYLWSLAKMPAASP